MLRSLAINDKSYFMHLSYFDITSIKYIDQIKFDFQSFILLKINIWYQIIFEHTYSISTTSFILEKLVVPKILVFQSDSDQIKLDECLANQSIDW